MKLSLIKQTLEKIQELPTLPVVAGKVNMLLSDPTSSAAELAELITMDQSITAKILKLVNSAYYSLPTRVSNIQQAVGLLGYRNISHIVLTLSVFDTLKPSGLKGFDRRSFWVHSIATAALGVRIARSCMCTNEDDVFTAGLLHDLGKVFMDGYFHRDFCSILGHASRKKLSFFAAETELCDVNHAMIGEWIARSWKFPLRITAVIKHHHQELEERTGLALSSDTAVDIIRLADTFVKRGNYGSSGDGAQTPLLPELFTRLPISEEDAAREAEKVPEDVKRSSTLLNFAEGS
jgi:putative nucleotidyltransferase with HDIG domain